MTQLMQEEKEKLLAEINEKVKKELIVTASEGVFRIYESNFIWMLY